MRNMRFLALAALLAALAPAAARADTSAAAPWSVTVSAWGGRSRYDVVGLRDNASAISASDGRDLLSGNFTTQGLQGVLRLGWFEVGALWEGSWPRDGAGSVVVTPLAGFKWDLSDFWRVEVLGELGGHRVSGIGQSSSFDAAQVKSVWLPSVGIRPSLSLRAPVGPVRAVFSLTPFARWDLLRRTVTVDVAGSPGAYRSYDVGGSTLGLVGAVGIEL